MTHSMKKQPKERPAPEDLMVSETSEPLCICLWMLFIHACRSVSHFVLHFSVCTNSVLNSFWLRQRLHIYREHTNQRWMVIPGKFVGILRLPAPRPMPRLWFGVLIQNFHSQYRVSIKPFWCSVHLFFSLYVQGLQLNVGQSLSECASLHFSKSEDWKRRMWSKYCIFNAAQELLFSLTFT